MSNKKKICTNLLDFFVRMDTIGVDPPGKYTYIHTGMYLKGTTTGVRPIVTQKITVLSIEGVTRWVAPFCLPKRVRITCTSNLFG